MHDEEFDQLVPDKLVREELGNVTPMTLWRWSRATDFPPLVKIGARNFRSRRQLEAFKNRLLQEALQRRAEPASRQPQAAAG
jgi:hypothetical protein